uniref:Alpha-actinin n=1 Tax=Trichomonas vaginalis TaxID=5722 RepID=O96524_TRIVA|nr:alpha-actinin [Trichomonas vaginalis]
MSVRREGLLDDAWEKTQIKVFSRWVQKQLLARQIQFETIETDFEDGTKLLNLLEIIGKEPMPSKWHKQPKMMVQKRENVDLALKYINEVKKIRTVGIGADDIINKNLKLTLGLTWTCINKFMIEEISVEEATARDALLLWAKKNTQGYEHVAVNNFTTSWNTGLAFAALINKFRPNLLDYSALDYNDHKGACEKAFAACKELGIYVYLDPEDVIDTTPDEKSVVTQVAEFFHFFASESKIAAMADKIKRTVAIQKQIDELKNTYIEDAKAAIEKMTVEDEKLKADDYEKTIPGIRGKLASVISYNRDIRPEIVDHRAKAMRSWAALVTKCKSGNRPIPEIPQGLEPEALTNKFNEIEQTSTTRRDELTQELNDMIKKKVEDFMAKCMDIINKCDAIHEEVKTIEGTTAEKKDKVEQKLHEAEDLQPALAELTPLFQELVELRINTLSSQTDDSVNRHHSQLITYIKHLLEQLNGKLFEETNEARINEYNALAQPLYDEAIAFKEEVLAISGELRERRTQFLAKQAEAPTKREHVNEIDPIFDGLEKDSLHLRVNHSPTEIRNVYAVTLQHIITELNKIFEEMVANFDATAVPIIDGITALVTSSHQIPGDAAAVKAQVEENLASLDGFAEKIQALQDPYNELVEFKLNYKVTYTYSDATGELDQARLDLKQIILAKKTFLEEEERKARINNYTVKADEHMNEAHALDGKINSVDGELEPKRQKLYEVREEVNAKKEKAAEELTPIYEDLEKDQLHLEITSTPASINIFFENLIAHIDTLVKEIDAAIAAAKGLEISEEELNEFKDTFKYFDKDKSNSLEYFELKACLTALGEDITDGQAKEYCKKYNSKGEGTALEFDDYVRFMLDHFSKAETTETTMEAFKAIAQNQPVLTDAQLDQYFSAEDAAYLRSQLKQGENGYEFADWVNSLYNH